MNKKEYFYETPSAKMLEFDKIIEQLSDFAVTGNAKEKIKELQDFIARFSANASKSKQATSRKKMLEKIVLDDIKPSSRRYPFIDFKPDRDIGNDVLVVKNLSKTIDGKKVLDNVSFTMTREDKVAFVGENSAGISALMEILALFI